MCCLQNPPLLSQDDEGEPDGDEPGEVESADRWRTGVMTVASLWAMEPSRRTADFLFRRAWVSFFRSVMESASLGWAALSRILGKLRAFFSSG